MKNIVEFEIISNNNVTVTHNGISIDYTNGPVTVECKYGRNEIVIEGIDFDVKSISMYSLGKNELKKLARKENGVWTLDYDYPVFTWLHKSLNYGWLLKEDDE